MGLMDFFKNLFGVKKEEEQSQEASPDEATAEATPEQQEASSQDEQAQ